MKYEDSSCTWDQLVEQDAFSIERHSLKITQPLETVFSVDNDAEMQLGCQKGRSRRFGRIDFSNGFGDWWFLSHTDIKVPSEHTQEGKRYAAEVQLAHFYSTKHHHDREMAHVSIFLDASDEYPVYPFLDRLICQWRQVEAATRAQCGKEPISSSYPSCFQSSRGFKQATKSKPNQRRLRKSAKDILRPQSNGTKSKLVMDPENWREPDMTDEEWEDFILQLSEDSHERRLLEGRHLDFHNYQFLVDVRTEYYFRYGGTQTVPPCHAEKISGESHGNTNHWRVMKDPIRVNSRQITELERLLKERIAPKEDWLSSCKQDTAGKIDQDGHISVARPLMETTTAHEMVFCECQNWKSKWPQDRAWCKENANVVQRFFEHPYNFAGHY